MADSSDNLIRRALKRLGLGDNPSTDEIKAAFRKLSKETHPDMGGNPEDFMRVKHAYDFLMKNYTQRGESAKAKDVVPYDGGSVSEFMRRGKSGSGKEPPGETGKDIVPYEGGGGVVVKKEKTQPPSQPAALPAPEQKPRAIIGTKQKTRIRLPHIGRHSDIVWTLVLIIVGMTVAALLGSMWIFFAFVCLAGYIIVPDEDEIIGGEMMKIKSKYIKRIENATSEQQRQAIEKDLEETLKNQRTVENIKAGMGMKYTSATAKYLLRLGFFVLFSLGFITSAIPLAKPVGIFLAFVGYYMEGA